MKTRDIAMASSSLSSDVAMLVCGSVEELKRRAQAPVRRNLFGPVDHEQLQQDFQRHLCMSVESANKRWDFDFNTGRPAAKGASVEWEEMKCQDVPVFYHSCVVRKPVIGIAGWRAERENIRLARASSPGSSSCGEEYLEVTTRESYRIQRQEKRTASQRAGAVKRRQAAITEFFVVKKRRAMHHKRSSRQ
ncbi:cyclin-dependent kinase inhibitor 1-like isoform X1 [Coregonus clupeaformis]|uniref:Cyclin-dependent kinase inhibitor domain-containing protein n=2 Tax=Coregonus TaxID=27772 RepID=A0AAN8QSK5_9TELE|nr:cyclin-dependent kinase inhibitor 1-like isoform X1 [Coregonus clupeaformis]